MPSGVLTRSRGFAIFMTRSLGLFPPLRQMQMPPLKCITETGEKAYVRLDIKENAHVATPSATIHCRNRSYQGPQGRGRLELARSGSRLPGLHRGQPLA